VDDPHASLAEALEDPVVGQDQVRHARRLAPLIHPPPAAHAIPRTSRTRSHDARCAPAGACAAGSAHGRAVVSRQAFTSTPVPRNVPRMHYPYVIVGGGMTAASAVEGIREHDPSGSILVVSRENHLPYRRP